MPASDIYAEAKNWAGELISGQTRAGKILVSSILGYRYFFTFHLILFRFSVFSFSLLSAYWSISEMPQRKIKQNIFLNIVIVDSPNSHGSQNIEASLNQFC